MRTIPHSIVSGLLALALTLTAAPAPALATAPDDIVFSQAAHGDDPGDSEDLPVPEEDPAGAKIGAVCYSTLSDALAAAVSGDTITLLEDAVLDGSGLGNTKGVLTLTQDLTIDGGSQAKNGLNLYDSTAVLENVTVENWPLVCGGVQRLRPGDPRPHHPGQQLGHQCGQPGRFTQLLCHGRGHHRRGGLRLFPVRQCRSIRSHHRRHLRRHLPPGGVPARDHGCGAEHHRRYLLL